MIRLTAKNSGLKGSIALILTFIMILQLFGGIDWSMVAEAATNDMLTIQGTISFSGDDDWKDIIRPLSFDCSKIKLAIYVYDSDGNWWETFKTLQDTNVEGEYHLSFIHNGNGGGSFVVSNIPKVIGDKLVKKCAIKVEGLAQYNDVISPEIQFDDTTGIGTSNANISVTPKMIPLNIVTTVKGESNSITLFDMQIKGTNPNAVNTKCTTMTNCVSVSKAQTAGKTVNLPLGLTYTVEEVEKEDYSLIGFNFCYIGTDKNNNYIDKRIQSNVKKVGEFTTVTSIGTDTVEKYAMTAINAADNYKVEWSVKWVDNYSDNRPVPSFALQYSIANGSYTELTESNMNQLGLTSMPIYKEVANTLATKQDTLSYYFDKLPTYTPTGKAISYKVKQTTASNDYIYEYDSENNIYYNMLKTNFVATMKWLDAGRNINQVRPNIDQIKSYLHFYSYIGDKYTEVNLSESQLEINQDNIDEKIWRIKINKELPQYSKDGNKINYVLLEGKLDSDGNTVEPIKSIKKDGYTGNDTYDVSYYNAGSSEIESDRCYAEQMILHTLECKFEFKATKIWKDDGDSYRPETKVILWRYPIKSSGDATDIPDKAARVTAKGVNGEEVELAYELKTSHRNASELADADKYTEIVKFDKSTIPALPDDFSLPKYDMEGNEYRYFITEVMDPEFLRKASDLFYENYYYYANGEESTKFVDNGGKLVSIKNGKVILDINKIWLAASTVKEFENASVTFEVYGAKNDGDGNTTYHKLRVGTKRIDADANEDVVETNDKIIISGFKNEITRINKEVCVNPYDAEGKKFNSVYVKETNIIVGGKVIPITHDEGDFTKCSFVLPSKTFTVADDGTVTTKDCENNYRGISENIFADKDYSTKFEITTHRANIKNIVTSKKDFSIGIYWGNNINIIDQTIILEGKSINVDEEKDPDRYELLVDASSLSWTTEERGVGKYILKNSKGVSTTYNFVAYKEDNGVRFEIPNVEGLQRYDNKGYLIEYSVVDVYNGDVSVSETVYGVNSDDGTEENSTGSSNEGTSTISSMSTFAVRANEDVGNTSDTEDWLTTFESEQDRAIIDNSIYNELNATITAGKTWYDDNDASSRYPIKVIIADKDDSTKKIEIELSEKNSWMNKVSIEDVKKIFKDGLTKENLVIKEVLIDTDEDDEGVEYNSYEGEDGQTYIETDHYTYKVNMKVQYLKDTRGIEALGVSITNVRTGKLSFVYTHDWIDGKNSYNTRPTTITLDFRQRDILGNIVRKEDIEVNVEENPSIVSEDKTTWEYVIPDLERYDQYGRLYEYYIQKLPTFPDINEESSDVETSRYETGMVESNYYNPDNNCYTLQFSATSHLIGWINLDVYIAWKDKSIDKKNRSDIYLSVFQETTNPDLVTTPAPLSTYRDQSWDSGTENDDFDWHVTYWQAPRYDKYGYKYNYYITEEIAIPDNKYGNYVVDYYKGGLGGDKQDRATNGDYIVNRLSDTVRVTGEKIWKNISGYTLKDLPEPTINLYRKKLAIEDYPVDDAHKINSLKLVEGQTLFEFTKDADENDLQKYDEEGEPYEYYFREDEDDITKINDCKEGDLYFVSYDNDTVINEFNTDTNTREIIVTKEWDRSSIDSIADEDEYPSVTMDLYRYTGEVSDIDEMQYVKTETISPKEFKASKGGAKEIVFDDILVYSPKGERYNYFVKEENINGYNITYSIGDGQEADKYNVTPDGVHIKDELKIAGENKSYVSVKNTYVKETNITLRGYIEWNDYRNYYGLRPNEVELALRKRAGSAFNDNVISDIDINFKNSTDEGIDKAKDVYIEWIKDNSILGTTTNDIWTYEIHNLVRYAPNGEAYTYLVNEQSSAELYYVNTGVVYNSATNVSSDGIIEMSRIINSFDGNCVVKKHWIDGDDKYELRPKSVTMQLQRSLDGTTWEDMYKQQKDSDELLGYILTKDDVIENTNGDSWMYEFSNLPRYDKVDADNDGIKEKRIEVKYRCIETKIGAAEFKNNSKQIGSYTMSVLSTDDNVTEIKNSMHSTRLNITKKWDDVGNYYQTRPNKVQYKLQRTEQDKRVNGVVSEEDWEDVVNVNGNVIILELSNDNKIDANTWGKMFTDLPAVREGDISKGEAPIVYLYYRVVECKDSNNYPQQVNVNGSSVSPTKTYKNYVDTTDYTSDWSYNDANRTNVITTLNHMIPKEEVPGKGGTLEETTIIEASKKWCKDDDANYYAVDIELQRSSDGTTFSSFPTRIIKTIEKDGPSVSWDHMPAYDEDGNEMSYKAVECTRNSWYRCHEEIKTTDENTGKKDSYTFTNIQLLDYSIKKVWSKNNRVLPTNIDTFRAKFKMQRKVGDDGVWEDLLDNNDIPITREINTYYRANVATAYSTLRKLDKYTVDNNRIYYRAVETDINNVSQLLNKAYTMVNTDLEQGGTVYSDNDETAITNTLRTVDLNITMNWDDANDHDNIRPTVNETSKFNIAVYADFGNGYMKVSPSLYSLVWDTSVSNVWTATLTNMPKYTYDGKTLIKYKVVQSAVPDRYFVKEEAAVPTFNDAIDTYNYSLTNTLNLLVKLKKYDKVNNNGLKGTKFNLYMKEDGKYSILEQLVADANGNISFELEELGDYKLIETVAVKGYEETLDDNGEPDVENGNAFECNFTVNEENLRQTVNFNNSNLAGNTTTNGSSNVVAPVFTVRPGWEKQVTATGLVNMRKLGILSFGKQDNQTKAMLNGVTFELYRYANEDGSGAKELIGEIVTGNNYICSTSGALTITSTGKNDKTGYVDISKLPWGMYTLKETKSLVGYALPSSEFTFEVSANTVNSTTKLNENIIISYAGKNVTNNVIPNIKTRFDFKKLGLNDVLLKGGTFKIVSNDGNNTEQKFWTAESDDALLRICELKSNYTVYGLPVGKYKIVEADAPYGYKYSSDVEFSIDNYGNIRNAAGAVIDDEIVTMRDKSIDIKIINVDEDFVTPINDATFELTGKFATNLGSEITEVETKTCTIDSLAWILRANVLTSEVDGTKYVYKLTQTKVPDGFEARNQDVYFKLDENYNIVLTDENGYLPSAELQEAYSQFIKVDNTIIPTIMYENLRIPKNDIIITNGEDYKDDLGNIVCKLFYAYDIHDNNPKLVEPIKFYIDKSNIGLIEFAVTTSTDGKDTSQYISSDYIRILDSNGCVVQATNNKYRLSENTEYRLYIDTAELRKIETGGKVIYLYSHMPRLDDMEGAYIVRRTSFAQN